MTGTRHGTANWSSGGYRVHAAVTSAPAVGSGALRDACEARVVEPPVLARSVARRPVPGITEEESVARPGQRQTGARRTPARTQGRVRPQDDVASVLART